MSTLEQLRAVLTPKLTKYIKHSPTAKQTAFLLLDCKEAFYGGAASGGKDIIVTTPIRTITGWKPLYEIHPGDIIYNEQGQETTVIAESEIRWDKPCYKLTLDEGTEIIASNTHKWLVVDNKKRPIVVTTEEIYRCNIKKYRIPLAKPIQGRTQQLPIAPYVLGYWLGAGHLTDSIICTNDIERIPISKLLYTQRTPYDYAIKGIKRALHSLNLIDNKHIPEIYLQGDFSERLELLRGLMDSNGHVESDGIVYFYSTEKPLVADVSFLIRSLGYKVTKEAGNCLTFIPTPEYPVFHLPRKRDQLNKTQSSEDSYYHIVSVEPYMSVPVKCITVDSSSHLYLLGKGLIPTHNSDALLMAALQYVDVPGYSAILFRKTFSDLALSGALLDRAQEWLAPYRTSGEVHWDERNKSFTFPSNATLSFGYLEHSTDKYRYQGAEFQFIGFDEVTQIDESSYRYLFSRLRRTLDVNVPLRMRAASNPGGAGHEWVKARFITKRGSRIFIPATLYDNPFVDTEQYVSNLNELDLITKSHLLDGNWDIKDGGYLFKRQWFEIVDRVPDYLRTVRFWDLAATRESVGKDPDSTVGAKVGEYRSIYYILDIRSAKARPYEVEQLVKSTATSDGYDIIIGMEQEPGASGIYTVDYFSRDVLPSYTVRAIRANTSKTSRATAFSAAAEEQRVKIVRADWNSQLLDELEAFPLGKHDDQVDAVAGGFNMLRKDRLIEALPMEVGDDRVSYWDTNSA